MLPLKTFLTLCCRTFAAVTVLLVNGTLRIYNDKSYDKIFLMNLQFQAINLSQYSCHFERHLHLLVQDLLQLPPYCSVVPLVLRGDNTNRAVLLWQS